MLYTTLNLISPMYTSAWVFTLRLLMENKKNIGLWAHLNVLGLGLAVSLKHD